MENIHKYEALAGSVQLGNITDDEVNADILRKLKANDPNLTSLWLQQERDDENGHADFVPTTATEMGWLGHFVGKSTQLKKLFIFDVTLGDWSGVIEPFCEGLRLNKSIGTIQIRDTDLSPGNIFSMMQPFFEETPSLVCLELMYCTNLGAEGFRHLTLALGGTLKKSLKEVKLMGGELGDGNIAELILALSMLPHLTILTLNMLDIDCGPLATLLRHSTPMLSTLILCGINIGNKGIELLAAALENPKSKSLTKVCLPICQISTKGIEALSTVLKSPESKLEELDLSFNPIGNNGAKVLATSLATNVNLKILDLTECNINDEGCSAFSTLLCDKSSVNKTFLSNHTLKSLLFSFAVRSGAVFASDIAPYLWYNQGGDLKQVAIMKTIEAHESISMQPFIQWELKVLPYAVNWFRNATSIQTVNSKQREKKKLSAIYEIIRALPILSISGFARHELNEMEYKALIVQQEEFAQESNRRALAKRKEGIQQRTQSFKYTVRGL